MMERMSAQLGKKSNQDIRDILAQLSNEEQVRAETISEIIGREPERDQEQRIMKEDQEAINRMRRTKETARADFTKYLGVDGASAFKIGDLPE